MTQQPFTRPGAIDLSGLKRPAPGAPGGGSGPAASGAYAVDVSEQNFQDVLESSMSAPVVLVFYSPTRSPESAGLAADLQTLANEFEGKFLLGKVDIDAAPSIAQAMQIPSVPLVALVAQGRPAPLFQDAPPIDELRTALNQVFQQLATQGFTGRHQPRADAGPVDENGEPEVDPIHRWQVRQRHWSEPVFGVANCHRQPGFGNPGGAERVGADHERPLALLSSTLP